MKTYTGAEVLAELARLCTLDSQRTVAASLGFAPQFINDVRQGRRGLTDKLARALGFEPLEQRYVRTRRKEQAS